MTTKPQFTITAAQLEAIEKSARSILGDDAGKVAKLDESFAQLRDTLVVSEIAKDDKEDEADGGADESDENDNPVKKGLLDLYAEVAKVAPAASAPVLQVAFEKAFGAIDAVFNDGIEAAFAAGTDTAVAKGGSAIGDNDDMETVMKKLPTPIAKAFADINKQNGELKTQVEKLQTERDVEVFGKKAVEIGQPVAFGETLRKLHAADSKSYDEVVKELTAKNTQIKKSVLFSEIGGGSGAAEGGKAIEKLNAKATEIRKSEPKLSQAKAFVKACEQEPELYREYKQEQRA
jgi:hypothetical protein